MQTRYVYAPVDSDITTWDDVVSAINDGTVVDVCATGGPNGGIEASCQNTMERYLTDESEAQQGRAVNCTGNRQESFQNLEEGLCQLVWDGVPEDVRTRDEYNLIPFPFPYGMVSFFRQTDFVEDETPPVTDKTSLEVALTNSFEQLVTDGTWDALFAGIPGTEISGYCSGDSENWPLPDPELDTDLQAVLDSGKFRWYVTSSFVVGGWIDY